MVYQVSKDLSFCYGHRLLNYDGKCKYLHGHNGEVRIVLAGQELDHRGMVVDFSDVKKTMNQWIDDNLDHKMLLNRNDPLAPIFREHGQPIFEMDANPTAEAIAKLIYDATRDSGFPVVEVHLWETPNSMAIYCPGSTGSVSASRS